MFPDFEYRTPALTLAFPVRLDAEACKGKKDDEA